MRLLLSRLLRELQAMYTTPEAASYSQRQVRTQPRSSAESDERTARCRRRRALGTCTRKREPRYACATLLTAALTGRRGAKSHAADEERRCVFHPSLAPPLVSYGRARSSAAQRRSEYFTFA